jgi:hypothetical protein
MCDVRFNFGFWIADFGFKKGQPNLEREPKVLRSNSLGFQPQGMARYALRVAGHK